MKYKARLLKMWNNGDSTVKCRLAIQFAEIAGKWRRIINPTARKENQKLTILVEETFFSDDFIQEENEVIYACIKEKWDLCTKPYPSYLVFEADILPFYPERDWVWKATEGIKINSVWIEEERNEPKTSKTSSPTNTAESIDRGVSSKYIKRKAVEETN